MYNDVFPEVSERRVNVFSKLHIILVFSTKYKISKVILSNKSKDVTDKLKHSGVYQLTCSDCVIVFGSNGS